MLDTFTSEQGQALAEGWPHLVVLSGSSKKDPVVEAADLLHRVDSKRVRWRRDLAEAYVRGHGAGAERPSPKVLEAMVGPPLTAETLPELLRKWVRKDRYTFQWFALIFAAEALVGPDAVVEAVASVFEGFSKTRWTPTHPPALFKRALGPPAWMGYAVGFPLIRAKAPERARERLAAVASRGPDGSVGRVLLELAVEGWAAARRYGLDLLAALHFAVDDPELVRACSRTARLDASLSPRFAWLGGSPVLEDFARRFARRVPAHMATELVEGFGVFAVPEVLPVMLALAQASSSRRAATRWFEVHADFARKHADRWRHLEGAERVAGAL